MACKCTKCGKTRNEGHIYNYSFRFKAAPGRTEKKPWCEGKCRICGKIIDVEHDYQPTDKKCVLKCTRCGDTRVEHQFRPVPGRYADICVFCGEESDYVKVDLLKSLTTDDIKAQGLTIPLFEKLLKAYSSDLNSFRDNVLIPCTDETILKYLIRCLDERDEKRPQSMTDKASTAARLLVFLYRSGRFTDEIIKQTGKVLQPAGEWPDFNMNDPLEREWAQGYYPEPEIRFDPEEFDGRKLIFASARSPH